MLRGIRFPDGVTTNLFDPCCGCGKALRQLAQGNNCYTDILVPNGRTLSDFIRR